MICRSSRGYTKKLENEPSECASSINGNEPNDFSDVLCLNNTVSSAAQVIIKSADSSTDSCNSDYLHFISSSPSVESESEPAVKEPIKIYNVVRGKQHLEKCSRNI